MGNKPRKDKPKKRVFTRRFVIVYLSLIIILIAAAGFGYVTFWRYLETYQAGADAESERVRPDTVADRVFDEYFTDFDYARFYAAEASRHSEFETLEHYTAFIDQKIGGSPLDYQNVPSGSADVRKYAVYAGGALFAEFTLRTQYDSPGNPLWVFENAETVYDRMLEPFGIVVPENSEVYINGVPVSDGYITGSETPSVYEGPHTRYTVGNLMFEPEVAAVLPDGTKTGLFYDGASNTYSQPIRVITAEILSNSVLYINGHEAGDEFIIDNDVQTEAAARLKLCYIRYRFSGSFGSLSLSAETNMGKVYVLAESGGVYKQEIEYDAELEEAYAQRAADAARTYVMYMTNDSSLTEIRRYFETGTPTYEGMRTSEVYWYTEHIGYRFENIAASEFYWHDEETFSCRVTLDHYIIRTAADTRYFPLDVSLFFGTGGDRPMIWELFSNT